MEKRRIFAAALVVLAMALPARADIKFTLSTDGWAALPAAVFVAGSFNNWSTTATAMSRNGPTTWQALVALADGRHFYKFVWYDAKGKKHWMNDRSNPYLADNGQHGSNNFIEVRSGIRIAAPDRLEAFEWFAPQAKWVSLAGDFNNWRLGQFAMVRDAEGVWRAYLPIRRPFSYKFIVDGIWVADRPDRVAQIPDFFGGKNSFRPADGVTSPQLARLDFPVKAGDARLLDIASSHAASADYGRAVALLRKVAEVNTASFGTTSPLVLRALDQEGRVHKRWNRLADAAECWKCLVATRTNTSETCAAADQLARYHLYVTKRFDETRFLSERLLSQTSNNKAVLEGVLLHTVASYNEKRFRETLAEMDQWLAVLPAPDGKDKDYACLYSDVLIGKGYCHFALKQWSKARAALQKAIQVHPWSDSQSVQMAQKCLLRIDEASRVLPEKP
jgi:hypothetical protein